MLPVASDAEAKFCVKAAERLMYCIDPTVPLLESKSKSLCAHVQPELMYGKNV